jgi:prophage antirepressor-like protein
MSDLAFPYVAQPLGAEPFDLIGYRFGSDPDTVHVPFKAAAALLEISSAANAKKWAGKAHFTYAFVPSANGVIQRTLMVSEAGFYLLVFRSTAPDALVLRNQILAEVLPQLVRGGALVRDPAQTPDKVEAEAPAGAEAPGQSEIKAVVGAAAQFPGLSDDMIANAMKDFTNV